MYRITLQHRRQYQNQEYMWTRVWFVLCLFNEIFDPVIDTDVIHSCTWRIWTQPWLNLFIIQWLLDTFASRNLHFESHIATGQTMVEIVHSPLDFSMYHCNTGNSLAWFEIPEFCPACQYYSRVIWTGITTRGVHFCALPKSILESNSSLNFSPTTGSSIARECLPSILRVAKYLYRILFGVIQLSLIVMTSRVDMRLACSLTALTNTAMVRIVHASADSLSFQW